MPAKKGCTVWNKKEIDINLMQKLYYKDKWDFKRIADFFGFKSKFAIYDRFKRLGLKARTNTDLKTGFKHSDETKQKISQSSIGHKHSDETRLKMSARFKGKGNLMYGKQAWNNKGGSIHAQGYKVIWIKGKRILEHRHIWEKKHGNIPKGYTIHHINRDKLDNRLDNLQLLSLSEHLKIHYKDRHFDNSGKFLSD